MTTLSPHTKPVILKNDHQIYIRSVQKQDVDGVWQNFNQVVAAKVFLPVYSPVVSKWEKDNWFKDMHYGKNFCLVAIDPKQFPKKQVVGQITIEDVPWEAAQHVGQLGIIVQDKYRNLGLGYLLIQKAFQKAKERGKKKIILSTLATNEHGIHLYRKCGFEQIGIHYRQYKIQEEFQDEILMEIWLE